MTWSDISIVIFSDADPGGCVRLLTDCERLEHQGFELEVVMVLQGLTDKVEALLKEYPFSFPIQFIGAPKDATRATGRNLGVAAAGYDHVLMLDSDMEVSPQLLMIHQEGLTADAVAVMGEVGATRRRPSSSTTSTNPAASSARSTRTSV